MMDRAALEKPFPQDLIKTRRGAYGQDLAYVEATHYVRRLNEAFESNWSWRIKAHEIRGHETIVLGELQAGGITKEAFGGTTITTNRSTGEVVSLADDLKTAATDALKKACSLFGVGLDMHRTANENDGSPERSPLRAVPEPARSNRREAPASNRLTAKQLKALYAIAHAQSLTDADLRKRSTDAYGVVPEYLSRVDASSFIAALGDK